MNTDNPTQDANSLWAGGDNGTAMDTVMGMERAHLEQSGVSAADLDQAQAMIIEAAKMAYQQAVAQGMSHEQARDAAIESAGSTSLHPAIAGDSGFIEAAVDRGVLEVANPMDITPGGVSEAELAEQARQAENKEFLEENEQEQMSAMEAAGRVLTGMFAAGGGISAIISGFAGMFSQQEEQDIAAAGTTLNDNIVGADEVANGTEVVAMNTPGMGPQQGQGQMIS